MVPGWNAVHDESAPNVSEKCVGLRIGAKDTASAGVE